MDISVIMVTYNRRDILRRTLLLYNQQVGMAGRFEVVLVDDGSTDGTLEMIDALRPELDFALKILVLAANDGPAKSRNEAIAAAQGELLCLTCDDILPSPSLLHEHWTWHAERAEDSVAVLGHIEWHPELNITPLMRWLETSGDQFAYGDINHGDVVPYSRFYTSNVSLKRRFLAAVNERLDERLEYGFEDTEWGQRLARKGMTLHYNAKAAGYHFHPTTLDSALRRMRAVGPSALVLRRINPEEFDRVTSGLFAPQKRWKLMLARLLLHPTLAGVVYRPLARLCEKRFVVDRVFALTFMSAMMDGLRAAGLRNR
jgi:glycosyltransferase involved in cell wall biosynthesis